jgi:hypothetical protein
MNKFNIKFKINNKIGMKYITTILINQNIKKYLI